MTTFRQFAPTTASVITPEFRSDQYDSFTVSADNLSGAETVLLLAVSGSSPKQVTDIYGVPINLTAIVSAVALEGGIKYQFIKSVTAQPCAVYVDTKER